MRISMKHYIRYVKITQIGDPRSAPFPYDFGFSCHLILSFLFEKTETWANMTDQLMQLLN